MAVSALSQPLRQRRWLPTPTHTPASPARSEPPDGVLPQFTLPIGFQQQPQGVRRQGGADVWQMWALENNSGISLPRRESPVASHQEIQKARPYS